MAIVGYWRLNGNSNDASGNGYNGSDTDVTYNSEGLNGSGLYNNSTSKTVISSNLGIVSSTPFTISIWIKQTANPLSGTLDTYINKMIYGNSSPYTGSGFYLRYHNNSGTLNMRYEGHKTDGSLSYYILPITLIAGKWYYLTMTWDGSNTLNAYFESLYKGTANPNNNVRLLTSDSFSMGMDLGDGHPLNGNLDNVIISNNVWSTAQVKNEYSRVKGFF